MSRQDNNVMAKISNHLLTPGAILMDVWTDHRYAASQQQLYILFRPRKMAAVWSAFRIGYYTIKNDMLVIPSMKTIGNPWTFFEHETAVIKASQEIINRLNTIAGREGYLSIHHLVKTAYLQDRFKFRID